MSAQIAWLPGERLHLNHGPIDVILQGWGDRRALAEGYRVVADRFPAILPELCAELAALRQPDAALNGPVARRMKAATDPFRPQFITPMAAVAGAVAEHLLRAFVRPGIARAYAKEGILSFAITPGFTDTSMAGDYLASRGGPGLLADIPLGRVATPDEIAAIIAFCALDAPASMTGAVIDANGASFVR